MRYEDHGAFKVFQGVHQHLLGRKIQVIRRFVEHQEVRRGTLRRRKIAAGHSTHALPPGNDLRNCSSQMMDSMSRWFVGSSISNTSGIPSRTRASATRIFHPPERAPTSPSI